ncbi:MULTISPECIES: hypothetical protein [Dickeya]|uniref:Uncharacterized protein n=1 Tax=Dickeya undicola TaxID=1577887 RepID=A0A3N0G7D1_9GAMM|nr:hypothetical protein [Dickeya undicola]RNM07970.1 hypothetical protein EF878_05595 [Dickeya undicola]
MMKKIAVLIPLLVVSGCAGEQVWVNPHKTTQDFYADRAACNSMSQGVSNPQIYSAPTTSNNPFNTGFTQGWNNASAMNAVTASKQIFSDCMMGKGWTLQDKGAVVQTPSQKSGMPQAVSDALKSVPELNYWHETNSPKFAVAIEADEILKKNSGWQKAPLDYRFRRAYEITKAVYGETAGDSEMCVLAQVLAKNGNQSKGALAALRMFPDFIVAENNKKCIEKSRPDDAFIQAIVFKIPDTIPLYEKAGQP